MSVTSSGVQVKIPRAARSQQFLTTFAGSFALIAAFLALDFSLARIDRNENRQHAANMFRDGQTLLSAGRPADAADRFATAVSLDRTNSAYGLGLAQAMLASRRYADAERLLDALLDRSPNDASVNLSLIHI